VDGRGRLGSDEIELMLCGQEKESPIRDVYFHSGIVEGIFLSMAKDDITQLQNIFGYIDDMYVFEADFTRREAHIKRLFTKLETTSRFNDPQRRIRLPLATGEIGKVDGSALTRSLLRPAHRGRTPYCERVIGSIRRECVDRLIILNEVHPRRILTDYFDYYHRSRTHLSLERNSPMAREVEPPSKGQVIVTAQVGGLHHRYTRAA